MVHAGGPNHIMQEKDREERQDGFFLEFHIENRRSIASFCDKKRTKIQNQQILDNIDFMELSLSYST